MLTTRRRTRSRTRRSSWSGRSSNWRARGRRLRRITRRGRKTVASETVAAGTAATETVAAEHAHSVLHHHFDDLDQQRECNSLGMWSFLATELMMFGGLFFAYTLYRWLYP